ncbi:MAG: dihydrofolate reductase [Candidatus Pacebacteria bacterium]|nr:dihydrofolate reductase [Candidatus Paceibacterota bacterium]
MISLIAGIGKNNELGKGNTLLWHMPNDLKHFKEITSGKTVIMGRKTFESIGRPLPNRRNIIITRDKEYHAENIEVVYSLDEAIEKVKDEDESFIIGGAEIYKQAINQADKLYITHIDASDNEADSFFPIIDKEIWRETKREDFKKDENNHYDYSFIEYIRK